VPNFLKCQNELSNYRLHSLAKIMAKITVNMLVQSNEQYEKESFA